MEKNARRSFKLSAHCAVLIDQTRFNHPLSSRTSAHTGVAISRYKVCFCYAVRWIVPGDCHGPKGPRNDRLLLPFPTYVGTGVLDGPFSHSASRQDRPGGRSLPCLCHSLRAKQCHIGMLTQKQAGGFPSACYFLLNCQFHLAVGGSQVDGRNGMLERIDDLLTDGVLQ